MSVEGSVGVTTVVDDEIRSVVAVAAIEEAAGLAIEVATEEVAWAVIEEAGALAIEVATEDGILLSDDEKMVSIVFPRFRNVQKLDGRYTRSEASAQEFRSWIRASRSEYGCASPLVWEQLSFEMPSSIYV